MRPIRILLAEMTTEARRNIEGVIARHRDLVLVGEGAPGGIDLLAAVRITNAEVVVIGLIDGELPGVCSHLVGEYPTLLVFGVGNGGCGEWLYRMRADATRLDHVLVDRLPEIIRAAIDSAGF